MTVHSPYNFNQPTINTLKNTNHSCECSNNEFITKLLTKVQTFRNVTYKTSSATQTTLPNFKDGVLLAEDEKFVDGFVVSGKENMEESLNDKQSSCRAQLFFNIKSTSDQTA